MITSAIKVGQKGEEQAVRYLQSLGYKLYDCNVRVKRDEIDIIAYDIKAKDIVFVEVKTRQRYHPDFAPLLNLTQKKKSNMQRAARRWIALHDYEGSYRIDVICIAENHILDHFKTITSDV